MDEYLPKETLEWCNRTLNAWGIDPYNMPPVRNEAKPFESLYRRLRTACENHVNSGAMPILKTLDTPRGGFNWVGEEWNE